MERRVNISPKLIIVLGVVLVIIVGVLAWMNYRENASRGEGTRLELCVDGEKVKTYSMDELMSMKQETVYAEFKSAKAEDESGDYSGVLLTSLIKESGASDCTTVILTAGDGYSSAAKASEADEVLIAYEKDGAPLGYFTKGGTGPLRAVFTEDVYGTRSIQYLTRINCK